MLIKQYICKKITKCYLFLFVQALAFCEYGKEPVVFKSITEGTIAKRKSGKYGWAWDFIFIPKG